VKRAEPGKKGGNMNGMVLERQPEPGAGYPNEILTVHQAARVLKVSYSHNEPANTSAIWWGNWWGYRAFEEYFD
jgi:hypothetical protein